MFNREILGQRLAILEQRRKVQGRKELAALIVGCLVFLLIAVFMPYSWRGNAPAHIIVGIAVCALVLAAWWIGKNNTRAQVEAGLACPVCTKPFAHREALHILLHGTCRFCNASIRS